MSYDRHHNKPYNKHAPRLDDPVAIILFGTIFMLIGLFILSSYLAVSPGSRSAFSLATNPAGFIVGIVVMLFFFDSGVLICSSGVIRKPAGNEGESGPYSYGIANSQPDPAGQATVDGLRLYGTFNKWLMRAVAGAICLLFLLAVAYVWLSGIANILGGQKALNPEFVYALIILVISALLAIFLVWPRKPSVAP